MKKENLMVTTMVSLFLLTITTVATADNDDSKYKKLTYKGYYHNIIQNQGFFAGADSIKANTKEGKLNIHLKNQEGTCEDTYQVSWSFSKPLQTIKPKDNFQVDYSIELVQGTCPEGYLMAGVEVYGLHGSDKVIANYPQNCEGVLKMGEIPSGNWRAYPGHPKQKKIITDDGVTIYSNRPLSCAYADLTLVVVGRGTQFELSYLFLSE